jgi:hypothetical protein
LALLFCLLAHTPARARAGAVEVAGGAGWQVSSLPQPNNFSSGENTVCEQGHLCDAYLVSVTNVGAKASSGPVTIKDTLPEAVAFRALTEAQDMETGAGLECKHPESEPGEIPQPPQVVECSDPNPVPPGDVLELHIEVTVPGNRTLPPSAADANTVEVTGGEAPQASVTSENSINGEAPRFGLEQLTVQAFGADGRPDVQAGDHPNEVVATLDYNSLNNSAVHPGGEARDAPVQETKTAIIDLPLGLVADPLAVAECPEADLIKGGAGCPPDTQVGAVLLDDGGKYHYSERDDVSTDIYNMAPEPGYPIEYAFVVANEGQVTMYPRFIPTPAGYELSISAPSLPRALITPNGVTMMYFGDPPLRDAEERQRLLERTTEHEVPLETTTPSALFSNPGDCAGGPLDARVEIDSWVDPHQWATAETPVYESSPTQGMSGCDLLQFSPAIEARPETTAVDTPSGYTVAVKLPQASNFTPDLATPPLKSAEVVLPEGIALSPAAASGLVACRADGPEGINIAHDWMPTGPQPLDPADPEAMVIGADGLPHVASGHCPAASQLGKVEITTPLLPGPLEGHLYVAEPLCGGTGQPECSGEQAEQGKLFRLYLEAEGSGLIVKLEGTVEVNRSTGQLKVRFAENPPLPFSELKLEFSGGEHAPLVNPQSCQTLDAVTKLLPWGGAESGSSEVPLATPSWPLSFSGCGTTQPFSPGFLAQTSTANAGGFSPLTATISRHDGEQSLAGFELHGPSGLLGLIAAVSPCGEPQASTGQCASESEVGHTQVAVGSGSDPLWETGTVYLTTGYEGAPFGLSIVTPAKIGPFNLGNIVVRAAIRIDPHTAALTIDSRLPQIVDGVPLRIQVVNLTIDRPGFILDPTNCVQQQIAATISGVAANGARGASVTLSTPFAVAGCKSLPFEPKITALAHAKTSKASGAYLRVNLTSGTGQDHLGKVKVVLPKQLVSRLTTLQKACIASVFESNPAGCPAGSVVGMGTAVTPLLKTPLSGPAYLVSHGGAAFPDLEIVLQGEGVTIILDGASDIVKGVTSDAFRALPDAPFDDFDLILSEGPNALLGANDANLCAGTLKMPTALTAQDGAVIKQTTKVAVSGCPKHTTRKVRKHVAKRARNAKRKNRR